MPERAPGSHDLERERAIAIPAKCTGAFRAGADAPVQIHLADAPGHAGPGSQVARILSMVGGAILPLDAAEGPMPQTTLMLSKALGRGLRQSSS